MEIRAENTNLEAMLHRMVSVEPGYEYSQPTAGTDGVSFPAMPFPAMPRLKRFAVAGVIAFGTAPLGSAPPDVSAFENRSIVVPSVLHDEAASLAEQYLRLREDIAASGVSMLTDEELRNEIRERRGIKPETED